LAGTVQRYLRQKKENFNLWTGVESRYWFFMQIVAAVNPANPAQYSWWTDAIFSF